MQTGGKDVKVLTCDSCVKSPKKSSQKEARDASMPLNFLLQTFIQSSACDFSGVYIAATTSTQYVYLTLFGTLPWCRLHNYDVQALFTLNRIALTPAGKRYRTGLLFKHILTVFADLFL